MNEISDTEAAYIAGFLDGEGYIALLRTHWQSKTGKTPTYVLKISVTNTDKSVLEWIKWTTGVGGVFKKRPAKDHYLPCWEWCVCSFDSGGMLLERLYPYLRIKRNQAEIGIKYSETSWKYRNNRIPQNIIDIRELLRERMLSENKKRRINSTAIVEKHPFG